MPRKPAPADEEQRIRDLIREAHEVIKDLREQIRQATSLTTTLTSAYQAHHDHEIKQLSNNLQVVFNKAAADLNKAVREARTAIATQLRASSLDYDPATGRISITYPSGTFDEHVPLPYPHLNPQEPAS